MTHTTNGRVNRLLVATGAFVAFAISHPASAQDANRAPGASESASPSAASTVVASAFGGLSAAQESQEAMLKAAILRVLKTEDESAPAGASADAKLASSIVGTVQDPSGAPVRAAELTVKNLATDEILGSTSDASGAFSIQNLTPGSYE